MRLRRLSVLPFVVLSFAAVGCTGQDDPASGATAVATPSGPTAEPTDTPSALPTVDAGAVPFEEGLFRYEFDAVRAELRWQGGEGELTVDNGSDRELGEPGLYAVTSDQREVPGEVADTAPIPPGESATFTISFPDDVKFDETGFVVLLFGDENWGAFGPVPAKDAA